LIELVAKFLRNLIRAIGPKSAKNMFSSIYSGIILKMCLLYFSKIKL